MDQFALALLSEQDKRNNISVTKECRVDNDYDGGKIELRIASIFVILICSTAGACFPIFARENNNSRLGRRLALLPPGWSFFTAKFFGSGVIIATAFIHLLSPAEDALRNPCLSGIPVLSEYDWVSGIMLITTFVLFCVELMATRYSDAIAAPFLGSSVHGNGDARDANGGSDHFGPNKTGAGLTPEQGDHYEDEGDDDDDDDDDIEYRHNPRRDSSKPLLPHHQSPLDRSDPKAQLAAIFILEFGVIFHSVFIGLTLAVSGDEFVTLFIVMIFHQTFEGLGLGARLAVMPWSASATTATATTSNKRRCITRRWTPYFLAFAFGLTTPIAIGLGLIFRHSYPPGSKTTLIVNGIFDSISAGILNYTGLVELMAWEIMFSPEMRHAPLKTLVSALALMMLGAGLMALLGKWA